MWSHQYRLASETSSRSEEDYHDALRAMNRQVCPNTRHQQGWKPWKQREWVSCESRVKERQGFLDKERTAVGKWVAVPTQPLPPPRAQHQLQWLLPSDDLGSFLSTQLGITFLSQSQSLYTAEHSHSVVLHPRREETAVAQEWLFIWMKTPFSLLRACYWAPFRDLNPNPYHSLSSCATICFDKEAKVNFPADIYQYKCQYPTCFSGSSESLLMFS